jgi:hypothetical protein
MDDWFSAPEQWFGRLVFLRGMAAIYLVAFLVAANQFRPQLGEQGMLPIHRFVQEVPFQRSPSLFHLRSSDRFVATVAWTGVALAAIALAGGADTAPLWGSMAIWALLWVLYLSIVNVGQTWYSFGWETLLLEAGFLAIFLGPSDIAPPVLVLWLLRWLLFRVEFGAGLIKLRGDPCWRDLTCLRYHHETQPMPGPLSWWFHRLPMPFHRVEVAANHVAQLVVPWCLFLPQPYAGAAALVIIVTQSWLVLSGNFSWLNVITITLATSVLGGSMLDRVLSVSPPETLTSSPGWHQAAVLALAVVIGVLSYRPARNLVSRRQLMNSSFEPLHLVNTYGAFGSITRVRYEVIVEGTRDAEVGPDTRWEEYQFKGKPGDPNRHPPQVAPYHLRLDWLMWFAALSPAYARAWFVPFVTRLLTNDPATLRLLRHNPFPDAPPAHVRARRFEYRYTTWAERRAIGAWWHRTPESEFLSPTSLAQLDPRHAGP